MRSSTQSLPSHTPKDVPGDIKETFERCCQLSYVLRSVLGVEMDLLHAAHTLLRCCERQVERLRASDDEEFAWLASAPCNVKLLLLQTARQFTSHYTDSVQQ